MPVSSLMLFPLALQAAAPLENLDALHAGMEAEAGAAIRPLDPRLRLARCPQPVVLTAGPRAVTATCPALGWRVHGLPLQPLTMPTGPGQSPAQTGPAIRRGDPVILRVPGRGFAVVLRTIALEDAVIGARIRLRRASGPATTMIGIVTAAGEAQPAG